MWTKAECARVLFRARPACSSSYGSPSGTCSSYTHTHTPHTYKYMPTTEQAPERVCVPLPTSMLEPMALSANVYVCVRVCVCVCVCHRYLIAKLRRQACISRLHHPPVKYTLDSKGRPTGRAKAVPANKFPAQNLEPAGDTADAATNQDTHSVDGVAGPAAHTSDGGDGGVGGVAPSAPPALYGPGGPSGYDNTPSAPSAPPAYDNGNRQAGHASNGGGVAGRDVEMPPVRS